MAALRAVAFGSMLTANTLAKSDVETDSKSKVWATVAYINHGESTPELANFHTVLTPEGAQQMVRQGAAFRSRYIDPNSSSSNVTGIAPILGISKDAIDNTQVTVLSESNEQVASSALAFLQGLYPPNTDGFNELAGGKDLGQRLTTQEDPSTYPLGGYQYPLIETLSIWDSQSPIVDGARECAARSQEMGKLMDESDDLKSTYNSSFAMYQDLFTNNTLAGTLSLDLAQFWNAYNVYDLVQYMFSHNQTVFDKLKDANETISSLKSHAVEMELAFSGNASEDADDAANVLRTIAGRTLAFYISQQLSSFVHGGSDEGKLTLLFGSFRPMLSFFSVVGLLNRENLRSGPLSTIPLPGAALVIELISNPDADSLPDDNDLNIRFSYRASANEDEDFTMYPLFGSGFDGSTIPYLSFSRQMDEMGESPDSWCDICKPTLSRWCAGPHSDDISAPSSAPNASHMNLAVAGVIGALIMAAVIALAIAGACVIGGLRLRRDGSTRRSSSLGGFKGAEKMPPDRDVDVTKGGAHHERVGSWEMKSESTAPNGGEVFGIVTKDFARRSRTVDSDGLSDSGMSPVNVRESV